MIDDELLLDIYENGEWLSFRQKITPQDDAISLFTYRQGEKPPVMIEITVEVGAVEHPDMIQRLFIKRFHLR